MNDHVLGGTGTGPRPAALAKDASAVSTSVSSAASRGKMQDLTPSAMIAG